MVSEEAAKEAELFLRSEEVAKIVVENRRLQQQVDELRATLSERTERALHRVVRNFHFKFGHKVRWNPTIPPLDELRFRAKLVAEEFGELLWAMGCKNEVVNKWLLDTITGDNVDLPEVVDAIADLMFVLEGTAASFGVHMQPVHDEVARANLTKGPNGPDGKPVKPEGWKPPDIEGVLREQGWTPSKKVEP